MNSETQAPLLELSNVSKRYGRQTALAEMSLRLQDGEILGLVGENGAGKSTLIRLISGVIASDTGVIRLSGRKLHFRTPADALAEGIATIHQELEVCGELTVAENVYLGQTWPRRPWGGIDWEQLHQTAAAALARVGLDVPPTTRLQDLPAARQREVMIATALARDARLLILDEPTTSLSEQETQQLLQRLKALAHSGVAIIYVSHRLDEVFAIADRILVLRDGQVAALEEASRLTLQQTVEHMLGRPDDPATIPAESVAPATDLLTLNDVTCEGMFQDVSLQVGAGEIVGLAGVVGSGRSEIARAIFGLQQISAGTMTLSGGAWKPRHPTDALAAGVVYLPEERKRQGLVLEHPLCEQLSIGFLDQITRHGLIDSRAESSRVAAAVEQFDVRMSATTQPVGTLSGGNQQKALLARLLVREPRLILLDEPTRGVDIGAKRQIHTLIRRLAAEGRGVLLISSDWPELVHLSHRLVVLRQGRIVCEMQPPFREDQVLLAASGLQNPESRS